MAHPAGRELQCTILCRRTGAREEHPVGDNQGDKERDRSPARDAGEGGVVEGAALAGWQDGKSIEQQVSFTIRFGHAVVTVDGKEREHITGRADILVSVDGKPTLVLELKRAGLGINDDDVEQGLSYARVLHPRPPLVLVTDGGTRRLVETHSGTDWKPVTEDEEALKSLLNNVALVAADDMKRATSRLLGSDPKAWVEAFRAVSALFVEERTGDWTTPELPFVEGFLLPRKAVADAVSALRGGTRLVLIEGDPVAGKSSALRALTKELNEGDEFAVLTLDADAGMDLFGALSDILSSEVFWPITPPEARHWIQQLSRIDGLPLVFAIDDFDGGRGSFRRDLEALTSQLFGDRIRVVLALDAGASARLLKAGNGRTPSSLARRGPQCFEIGPLDDREFADACEHLETHGIRIMAGGERSKDYRQPWVLRTMVGAVLGNWTPEPGKGATLPSIPTLELLEQAKARFRDADGLIANYREVAEALIDDLGSGKLSLELQLLSLETYVVRRSALRERLSDLEVRGLIESGLLHEGRSRNGEAILYPKLQDALAFNLTQAVAGRILGEKDLRVAARNLAGFASSVTLGPVIAAQAIFEAAQQRGSLDYALIETLRKMEPRPETLGEDLSAVGTGPDGEEVELTGLPDGKVELRMGEAAGVFDAEDFGSTVNLDPWIVLSYVATKRIALEEREGGRTGCLDANLILQIGSYVKPLIKPENVNDSFETHSLPGGIEALHHSGIVEPITYAILILFTREPEIGRSLIGGAIQKESLALLVRIDAALTELVNLGGSLSDMAAEFRREAVRPAIRMLLDRGDEILAD